MYVFNQHWQKHTAKVRMRQSLDSTVHSFVSCYLYVCTIMLYEPHAGKIYYSMTQVLTFNRMPDAIISKIAAAK